MRATLRDRVITVVLLVILTVTLTATAVASTEVSAHARAEADFLSAAASWDTALEALNTAESQLSDGRAQAQAVAAQASALLAVADPTMLEDPTKTSTAQTALDAVVAAATLTITAPGEVAVTDDPAESHTRVQLPATREERQAQAAALRDDLTALAAAKDAADLRTETIAAAVADLDTADTAIIDSAAAKAASLEAPQLAASDTVDAFTAAVAGLTAESDVSPAERIRAYQDAWAAVQKSQKDAEAAANPGRGSSDDVQPTYINGILVVNKTYALPSWFGNGLTPETTAAFDAMRAEAASQGLNLYISSGFRSYASQTSIYNRFVASEGVAGADAHSARPGHSEHQTGMAIDLNTISEEFGSTPEGKWVAANAHRFGFIVRYPQGKQAITGYVWEPWHLRYLGVDQATAVYNSGLTLEEYLGVTSVYR